MPLILSKQITLYRTSSGDVMYLQQRWANNSVFEYIRIVRTEYIRKPNYSVLFKNRIIFIFGPYFQTKYIRIRILFLFLIWIYSYSYLVFIFEPNIYVFVFGFYFQTKYIRIRVRFLFLNLIYSYSVFIFEPNIFVFLFGGQNTIRSPLNLFETIKSKMMQWMTTLLHKIF